VSSPLEEKFDRFSERVAERLGNIDVTLAHQASSLREHMRRTDLLEREQKEIRKDVKPLTRAHHMWAGVGKATAVIGTLLGVVAGILKVLGRL
jgi:hypothetical protein